MSGFLSCGRPCRIALATLLLAAAAPHAEAQRLADLPNGTLLRVRTEGTRDWREGTFVAITPDSLALEGSGQIFVLPRGQIRAFERRDRDARRTPRVLIGGTVGALVGVAAVIVDVTRCEQGPPPRDMCGLGIIIAPPAALLGFAVGAVVGALLPVERWLAVELP
jgi:hypothetical protein